MIRNAANKMTNPIDPYTENHFLSFIEISEQNGSLCGSHSGSLWLSLHYGEVEKNGWKWSTLRAFFSAVCSENTCKKLLNAVLTPQESMKNLVLKKLKQKMVKKAKKPVAHVC